MISVIIPVYNAQDYIENAISGLLNSNEIEIIVVDDCSNDNSIKILEKYKNKITLIKNEKNIGAGASRNIGIFAAKGDYIGFLDNDDRADSSYYLDMAHKIKRQNADVCVSLKIINHTSNRANLHLLAPYDLRKIVFVQKTAPWAKLYRRDFLIDNEIFFDKTRGEDIYPAFKCAFLAKKIAFTKKYPYHCTIRKNSLSHRKTEKNDLDEIKVYEKILNFIASANISDEEKKYWHKLIFARAMISFDFLYRAGDKNLRSKIIQEFENCMNKKITPFYYCLWILIRKFEKMCSFLRAKFNSDNQNRNPKRAPLR